VSIKVAQKFLKIEGSCLMEKHILKTEPTSSLPKDEAFSSKKKLNILGTI